MATANVTANQVRAAIQIAAAVAEAIREAGEIPSGPLYAALMGKLDYIQYEQVIGALKRTGLVRESSAHLLTWIGPEIKPAPLTPVEVLAARREIERNVEDEPVEEPGCSCGGNINCCGPYRRESRYADYDLMAKDGEL